MKHFLFVDDESGAEFIVGADTVSDATEFARLYFNEPRYLCRLSEMEAEASGLDEY